MQHNDPMKKNIVSASAKIPKNSHSPGNLLPL